MSDDDGYQAPGMEVNMPPMSLMPRTFLPEFHIRDEAKAKMAVAQLAEPRPDCGALALGEQITKKVDEATIHIVGELDDLIKEIEAMKTRLIEESDMVKQAVTGHLKLGAEARAFRDRVSDRLKLYPNSNQT